MPEIVASVVGGDRGGTVQRRAERVRRATGTSFVVTDTQRIRYSHPMPSGSASACAPTRPRRSQAGPCGPWRPGLSAVRRARRSRCGRPTGATSESCRRRRGHHPTQPRRDDPHRRAVRGGGVGDRHPRVAAADAPAQSADVRARAARARGPAPGTRGDTARHPRGCATCFVLAGSAPSAFASWPTSSWSVPPAEPPAHATDAGSAFRSAARSSRSCTWSRRARAELGLTDRLLQRTRGLVPAAARIGRRHDRQPARRVLRGTAVLRAGLAPATGGLPARRDGGRRGRHDAGAQRPLDPGRHLSPSWGREFGSRPVTESATVRAPPGTRRVACVTRTCACYARFARRRKCITPRIRITTAATATTTVLTGPTTLPTRS